MKHHAQQRTHALAGYAVLGADHAWAAMLGISPAQAVSQAIQASGVNSGTIPASTVALIQQSAAAGQLIDPNGDYQPGTASCAASGVSGGASALKLVGSAGSLGLEAASAPSVGLIAAGPATLGISIAIAGIVGIFSTILAHHAAAVKKEQNVLCSAVPAANNYLSIIASGVAAGQATPAQGIQALQSLSSDFDNAVSSIRKMGGGSCNAACVMTEELRAIIAYMSSEFQDMESQAIAAGASTVPPPASIAAPIVAAPTATTSTGPTAAAPVTSGSTMQLPVSATPAQIAAVAATPTPSLASELTADLPTWWPIAAVGLLALFILEAA